MYQCPACRATFNVLPETCPECGILLRVMHLKPLLTPHDGTALIVLTACDSQLEAEILIGRLKSEGIEAMITGTSLQSTMGVSDAGSDPYHVLVHEGDAERALRLLGTDASWTEEELNRYLSMLAEGPGD